MQVRQEADDRHPVRRRQRRRVDARTGHHQEPQVRSAVPNQRDRVQYPAQQIAADAGPTDGHDAQPLVRARSPNASADPSGSRQLSRVETRDVAGEVEVLLHPAADRRQAGAEVVRHHVSRDCRRRSTGPGRARNLARCSSISALRSAVRNRSRSSASGIGNQPTKSVSQPNLNRLSSGFSCRKWSTSQASSPITRSKYSDSTRSENTMKLLTSISSIRRIAENACRSCSPHSLSIWADSLSSAAEAGWIRSP